MKTRFILCFLLTLFVISGNSQTSVLEKCRLSFDFESGSVGPWASYPPAQDVAYDPTIWVKPVAEFSGSKALTREITPLYPIAYLFGVRKKVDVFVDATSSLSFKYYIKKRLLVDSVLVKFGFEDGASFTKNYAHDHSQTTGEIQFSFSEIVPSGNTRHLRGLAFMVYAPKADPEALMRFAVDDIRVDALRAKSWKIQSPAVHHLDEWSDFFAAEHFSVGDKLQVSANVPFAAQSADLHLSRALTGNDPSTISMKKDKNNGWSVNLPLKKAGMWRAELRARDAQKRVINSSFVFLVRPKTAPEDHPRLFISKGEEKKILDKAKSGHLKNVWEKIQEEAKTKREENNPDNFNYNLNAYDETHWLPTYQGYVTAIKTPAGFIRDNAVVYGLAKDTQAGEAARRALQKMASWPSFVHPHILNQGQFTYWPVGLVLIDFALGYDFTYDLLTPEDRETIADALFRKGVKPVFDEYVRDNRVSSNTSNWISHVAGGGILCALAIAGEYSDSQLEPYLTGMILKVNELVDKTFDRDGGYGEGYSYHNFTMQTLSEIMPALERNFGIQFPAKIADSYKYLLYQRNAATNKLLDFGDTNDKYFGVTDNQFFPMGNFAHLIGTFKDPHLAWLYNLSPGELDRDLFFFDASVKSEPPDDLPPVKHFRDVGTVIFRSGFGPEDFTFVFRCGPFYNHQHFDQGSFFLSDYGIDFITEAGKTDYYEDPWYQKFFIQPGGHNCILVDGNVESQRAGDITRDVPGWNDVARITDFLDCKNSAFVAGDLTKIYKGKFQRVTRNILYVKPRTIVIIDNAIGASDAKIMNLRFHAPRKNDFELAEGFAKINKNGRSLFIKTISNEEIQREVLKRPLSLSEFGKENAITMQARGFLQMNAALKPEGNTVINVLTSNENILSNLKEKSINGATQLQFGDETFYINSSNGEFTTPKNYTTDAIVFSAESDNHFIGYHATSILRDENKLFSALSPVSVEITRELKTTVRYSSFEENEFQIFSKTKPRKILLNATEIRNWTYGNSFVTLNVTSGEGTITIFY